jgi:hypothetical protein
MKKIAAACESQYGREQSYLLYTISMVVGTGSYVTKRL